MFDVGLRWKAENGIGLIFCTDHYQGGHEFRQFTNLNRWPHFDHEPTLLNIVSKRDALSLSSELKL